MKDPEHDSEGVQIGTTPPFTELHARHKRAVINQTQSFTIVDQTAFSEFTQFMITSETFSWRLSSSNLRVQALKFPVAKGISFDKRVDLKGEFVERLDCSYTHRLLGINNFNGNIQLLDFRLPSDNPAGGIDFEAVTQLSNARFAHDGHHFPDFAIQLRGIVLSFLPLARQCSTSITMEFFLDLGRRPTQ